MFYDIGINTLQGKTLTSVKPNGDESVIIFKEDNGNEYQMYHDQDCCESVYIEDINGDLNDLINTPILLAEERTSDSKTKEQEMTDLLEQKNLYNPDDDGTELWTFYEFQTIKGSVNIRWYGTSNGYYSMGVSFLQVT